METAIDERTAETSGQIMPVVHTPGPWTLKPSRCAQGCCDGLHTVLAKYEEDSVDDPGRPVATVNGGNAVWLREGETEGNAALIAAAPELLAACEAAMRLEVLWCPKYWTDPGHKEEVLVLGQLKEKIETAIAKARVSVL